MRISDWSSDVCSSDLIERMRVGQPVEVHSDLYGGDVTYHGHIAGLGAGSGSAFALLPAQNASGNWIKKIGRASCRERVCQYVLISVVAVSLTKKKKQRRKHVNRTKHKTHQ